MGEAFVVSSGHFPDRPRAIFQQSWSAKRSTSENRATF